MEADELGASADQAPDIEVLLDSASLPDDAVTFEDDLAREISAAGVRPTVTIDPDSEERGALQDAAPMILHFLTVHGLEIAISVASDKLWAAIRGGYRRLRHREAPARAPTHVRVQYRNGPIVDVDLADDRRLKEVLRELRADATS